MIDKVMYKTSLAAGFDLPSAEDLTIEPGKKGIVDTGITFQELAGDLPTCFFKEYYTEVLELQLRPRSGLSFKHDIIFFNTVGTIDADFTHTIKVKLWNTSDKPFKIEKGDRIAQGMFSYVIRPDHLPVGGERDGGFGSTGRK